MISDLSKEFKKLVLHDYAQKMKYQRRQINYERGRKTGIDEKINKRID